MSFGLDMVRPCPKCPFRNDIPAYLRPGRVQDLQTVMVDQDGYFSCHETTISVENDETGESETTEGPNAQHCAGAMILLHKMGMPNQMMRIEVRLRSRKRELDQDNPLGLDLSSPVYGTFEDMIAACRRNS